MNDLGAGGPPRPLAVGDVVATFSEELGEWAAAQITSISDPGSAWGEQVAVLELDWSGAEPFSVDELGPLKPLALTHHAHGGGLSHCHFEWLLPRSYKVIGRAELVTNERTRSYAHGWRVGDQLARQRRWDQGHREDDPRHMDLSGPEVSRLAREHQIRPDVLRLRVDAIEELDCTDVATVFPHAVSVSLAGDLGTLVNARALGRLTHLKRLAVSDLFGMTAEDAVGVDALNALDLLALHSVPSDYARAMKRLWKSEVTHGTDVRISSPRKPEWLKENRDNPLRDWDGRSHISAARYRKSVAAYTATRRAVLDVLRTSAVEVDTARLLQLGREFGEAFNRLDGTRSPFIETEEREELFAALMAIPAAASADAGRPFTGAAEALAEGLEAVRDW